MSEYLLETEEDMAAYLDTNYGHGIQATYTNDGTSTSINIIFNNEFIEQDALGVSVEATQPMAYCRSIDIPNVSQGNTLAVSATKDVDGNTLQAAQNFTIVTIQNDRTGFIALELEKI